MKKYIAPGARLLAWLLATVILAGCSEQKGTLMNAPDRSSKKYDLVLVHGLLNKHRWSPAFLDVCLRAWGSGRVFVVFTNSAATVETKILNDRRYTAIGRDDHTAGTADIPTQTAYLENAVKILQAGHGLSAHFDLIAHSMGGLVSRHYIHRNPDVVAGLVTLGTPHQGSPLADSFEWAGFFLGAREAIKALRPESAARFNETHPASAARLLDGGAIQTIRGNCPAGDCFGWGGELALGWRVLKTFYNLDSDGLVPQASALLAGAGHLADFNTFDHQALAREPSVAAAAAACLP
ncbi:MAG: alpha/beta hydrolase [Pseudomonadota bacterium]